MNGIDSAGDHWEAVSGILLKKASFRFTIHASPLERLKRNSIIFETETALKHYHAAYRTFIKSAHKQKSTTGAATPTG